MTTQESVARLVKDLKNDEDYRRTWKANIIKAFKDGYTDMANNRRLPKSDRLVIKRHIHEIANNAANNFLNKLARAIEREEKYVYAGEVNGEILYKKK